MVGESVCLVYKKFLSSSEGCCILSNGVGFVDKRGWRDGTR